jgi:putative colanic acid biosynthesis UDP-glucose lipid carrier transferase
MLNADGRANWLQSGSPRRDVQNDNEAARIPLKAIGDFALATLGFALFLPASTLIALAIKLDSRGPVFARQKCQGCQGRTFEILRFRTVRVSEDRELNGQDFRGNRALTRMGWFLCRTGLVELPRLINVLRGELSIVGPSPHSLAHSGYSRKSMAHYADRNRVKPGLTGWAQVHGLGGEPRKPEIAALQLRYDLDYIDRCSIRLDFRIIAAALFGPRPEAR